MGLMADKVEIVWELMDRYEQHKAKGQTLDMLLVGDKMQGYAAEVVKMQDELYFARKDQRKDITPDMIERAKAYPFDRLVEFKNRSAMCPFHDGKTPALRYYPDKNLVWCFACGKGWDTILWVREVEGKTFIEAVRGLQ